LDVGVGPANRIGALGELKLFLVAEQAGGHGGDDGADAFELFGKFAGAGDDIGEHVGAMWDANHREVAHAAEEAVGAEGPVEACEQLVGARAVVGIDEADFGDAVIEGEDLTHRSQADHMAAVGVGAVAATGLSGGGELEAGVYECLQDAVGVDEPVGGFGALGSGAGEDGGSAAPQVIEGEALAHCLGVGGGGGFGDRVRVHSRVSMCRAELPGDA